MFPNIGVLLADLSQEFARRVRQESGREGFRDDVGRILLPPDNALKFSFIFTNQLMVHGNFAENLGAFELSL